MKKVLEWGIENEYIQTSIRRDVWEEVIDLLIEEGLRSFVHLFASGLEAERDEKGQIECYDNVLDNKELRDLIEKKMDEYKEFRGLVEKKY